MGKVNIINAEHGLNKSRIHGVTTFYLKLLRIQVKLYNYLEVNGAFRYYLKGLQK